MMNAVTWFEIPSEDFERAVKFYETLLQISMRREIHEAEQCAFFPFNEAEKAAGGVVTKVAHAKPGGLGSIVYLSVRNVAIFDQALAQVEQLGGNVVVPKTDLGPIGYVAVITDCEGNRVGLSTDK